MTDDVAIAVEDLSKRFGEQVALDGVSFDVDPGTVFGLLGPNGAGKTTAIRVLTTLLRPDRGRASVAGFDVVGQPRAVRRLIGMAGQYAAVDVNLTGRENLRLIGRLTQLGRAEYHARADELLDTFELSDAASRPVRTYSGGMRRRLDVAAALVARPPVLFFDEPTTGLDLRGRNGLWNLIRELVAGGTTVVLTTQYLEEADRLCDRVAVIDRGQVIANDAPAALKTRLGATVIDLGLDGETAATRARELLNGLPDTRTDRRGSTVHVTADDGSRVLIETLHLLETHGLRPVSLQIREPSMDDVFLQLTGRRIPDAPGDGTRS